MTAPVNECQDLVCTRRRLLAGAGALGGLGALEVAAPRMAFAAERRDTDLLLVVSLRGGADGLSLVPPIADHDYLAARPDIAVRPAQALRLDRQFGLHPAFAPLMPYWHSRQLAVVHAVGDSDGTRSHFEATDAMERGVNVSNREQTGWIDRLMTARGLSPSDFPAMAVGTPPGSLRGGAPALSLSSVSDLRVQVPRSATHRTEVALSQMYDGISGPNALAARQTLDALRRLAPYRDQAYVPRRGVTYPTDSFGHGLSQIAQIARAGLGLEVATIDAAGGWDMHEALGTATGGLMYRQVTSLANGLAAFARDLGPLLARTTIVTVSEFGRRVQQNGSGGVDHGHGSAMLVLGGGIRGGRVYGRWPGLGGKQLEHGDLRPTTDYRDVLGELVHRRLGGARILGTVFPDHRPHELGLARQR
ncbi:MAG: DUF1501 domain-containing protein [Mycobacteriales bacterium]